MNIHLPDCTFPDVGAGPSARWKRWLRPLVHAMVAAGGLLAAGPSWASEEMTIPGLRQDGTYETLPQDPGFLPLTYTGKFSYQGPGKLGFVTEFGDFLTIWVYGVYVFPSTKRCRLEDLYKPVPGEMIHAEDYARMDIHPEFPGLKPTLFYNYGEPDGLGNVSWECGKDAETLTRAYLGRTDGAGCATTTGWNKDNSKSALVCCGSAKMLQEILVEAGVAVQLAPFGGDIVGAADLKPQKSYWMDGVR